MRAARRKSQNVVGEVGPGLDTCWSQITSSSIGISDAWQFLGQIWRHQLLLYLASKPLATRHILATQDWRKVSYTCWFQEKVLPNRFLRRPAQSDCLAQGHSAQRKTHSELGNQFNAHKIGREDLRWSHMQERDVWLQFCEEQGETFKIDAHT